jgi:hypothetical protein
MPRRPPHRRRPVSIFDTLECRTHFAAPSADFAPDQHVFNDSNFHELTVLYSDDGLINRSTIGPADLQITGPQGYTALAELVSASPDSNASTISALYRFPGPGGSWDASDAGTYQVQLRSNQVADTLGNFAPGALLGQFDVSIPPISADINGVITFVGTYANDIIRVRDQGEAIRFILNDSPDLTYDYDPSFITRIILQGHGGDDTFSIEGGTLTGAIDSGAGENHLILSGGVFTLDANLKIQSLSITNDALLDLADSALIIDAGNLDQIKNHLSNGRGAPTGGVANAPWTGTRGITSSSAAAFNQGGNERRSVGYARNGDLLVPYDQFAGEDVDEDDILVRYTKNGDANLDGVVNNNDITILAGFYRPGQVGRHWHQADFNYDGFTDNNDITILAGFYKPDEPPVAPVKRAAESETPVSVAFAHKPSRSSKPRWREIADVLCVIDPNVAE